MIAGLVLPMEQTPDVILCMLGLGLCLLGWVVYWGGLHTIGAATGAGLAVAILLQLWRPAEIDARCLAISAAVGLLGLCLGVYVVRRLHFGALAVLGGALGGFLGCLIGLEFWGQSLATAAIGALAGALLGGLLFVYFHCQILVLSTSACGAILLGQGFGFENSLLATLILFPVAAIIQFGVVSFLSLQPRGRRGRLQPRTS